MPSLNSERCTTCTHKCTRVSVRIDCGTSERNGGPRARLPTSARDGEIFDTLVNNHPDSSREIAQFRRRIQTVYSCGVTAASCGKPKDTLKKSRERGLAHERQRPKNGKYTISPWLPELGHSASGERRNWQH